MCVIVDTCCISKVFDTKAKEHKRFAPLLAWINGNHGRLIIGGSKYWKELSRMTGFLSILLEYEKQGRVIRLDKAAVDDFASYAKTIEHDPAFNDEHIVGIVAVSRCRVVCTDDKSAIPFITRKSLYSVKNLKPPKIYSQQSHKHLCRLENVTSICKKPG